MRRTGRKEEAHQFGTSELFSVTCVCVYVQGLLRLCCSG